MHWTIKIKLWCEILVVWVNQEINSYILSMSYTLVKESPQYSINSSRYKPSKLELYFRLLSYFVILWLTPLDENQHDFQGKTTNGKNKRKSNRRLAFVAQESHKNSTNGACQKLASYWEILSSKASLDPCGLASIHWFLVPSLAPDRSCWDLHWKICLTEIS